MQFSTVFASLALVVGSLADGPYTAEYDALCGNGTTRGEVATTDKTFYYQCDTTVNVETQGYRVNSAKRCATLCDWDANCDGVAVWDHTDGVCYKATASPGPHRTAKGMIYLSTEQDPLAQCEDQLDKWGPVEAICPKNTEKPVEASNGKKFLLACKTFVHSFNKLGDFDTFGKCIDACAEDDQCRYATWRGVKSECWAGNKTMWWNEIEKDASGWDSAALLP